MINTIEQNQQQSLDHLEDVWLFGYGSLMFKADFPFLEKRQASITGWVRRFWQGSHDHRGTPEKPGRVVTLIEEADAVCDGLAYRVSPETFAHLDFREKNGYLRFFTPLTFADPDHAPAEGLVYVAAPDNAAFIGEAPLEDMAVQIATSVGPSGPNAEYLLQLAETLVMMDIRDAHVEALAARVRELLKA